MNAQCPNWFQCDYDLLKAMFCNLEQLVENRMLKNDRNWWKIWKLI